MSENLYDVTSVEFSAFAADEMTWEDRTPARFTCGDYELFGTVLGFDTSRDPDGHSKGSVHPAGTRPPEGVRCSACRWAEIAVLLVRVGGGTELTYAILKMGKTILEGEETRVKTFWSEDAMSVLENLHVSGPKGANRRIPLPNAGAFRLAAEVDAGIRAVLDEWSEAIPEPREPGVAGMNAPW